MTNFILTINSKDGLTNTYFTHLEDAREALKTQVREPIAAWIKELNVVPELRITKVGKKKKAYTYYLPYDLIQGHDYVACYDKNTDEIVLSGVVMEVSKIKALEKCQIHDYDLYSEDEDE